MDGTGRKIHIGNYVVPKMQLQDALVKQFGPCQVTDPFKPKNGKDAFGFVTFNDEAHGQACLDMKRITIGNVVLRLSNTIARDQDQSRPQRNGGSFNSENGHSGFSFSAEKSFSSRNVSSPGPAGDGMNLKVTFNTSGTNLSQPKKFPATLCYSNGLEEIYIQDLTASSAARFKELHSGLQELCPVAPTCRNPQPNKVYGVLYELDGLWYRCKILNTLGNARFSVKFIDFGNSDVVAADEIKDLPQELQEPPAAACQYYMKDLLPKPDCSEKVREILKEWEETLLDCELSPDNSIDLINNETEKSLRTTLVNSGLVTLRSIGLSPLKNNPARNTNSAGTFGDSVNSKPSFNSAGVNSSDPKKFPATLSYTNGLNELYVQDLTGSNAARYRELHSELQEFCPAAPTSRNPQLNKVYGVLYELDNVWYRCKILNSMSNGRFLAKFIDFGNSDVITAGHIKDLTQDLQELPPAACQYFIKDLVPKPDCFEKVAGIIKAWEESLLDCELSPDNSINLINKETGQSLRHALVNSGLVTLPSLGITPLNNKPAGVLPQVRPSLPTEKSRTAENDLATGLSQDLRNLSIKKSPDVVKTSPFSNHPNESNAAAKIQAEESNATTLLTRKNADLEKKLRTAETQLLTLRSKPSIDSLHKELSSLIVKLKEQRHKLPLSEDCIINKAIALINSSEEKPEENLLKPMIQLHEKYQEVQQKLRDATKLTDVEKQYIAERNKIREDFVELMSVCDQRQSDSFDSERRSRRAEALLQLLEAYPEAGRLQFSGDSAEQMNKYLNWQSIEGHKLRDVLGHTDVAIQNLRSCLHVLYQSFDMKDNQSSLLNNINLEELTSQALDHVKTELRATELLKGNPLYTIVSNATSALCSCLKGELAEIDASVEQYKYLQEIALVFKPWINHDGPDVDQILNMFKTLRKLKSDLRHRQADLLDLQETEDPSDTEVKRAEQSVVDLQSSIHSLLVDMEGQLESLSTIMWGVFPELNLRYPEFKLNEIKRGQGLVKPLRELSFYDVRENSLQTVFHGKQVILKTFTVQNPYEIPVFIENLTNYQAIQNVVSVDAVFFSKNGREAHVQLSSPYSEVLDLFQASDDWSSPTLVEGLLLRAQLPIQELSQSAQSQCPSSVITEREEDFDYEEEYVIGD